MEKLENKIYTSEQHLKYGWNSTNGMITAMAASEDDLYVGTSTGQIFLLNIKLDYHSVDEWKALWPKDFSKPKPYKDESQKHVTKILLDETCQLLFFMNVSNKKIKILDMKTLLPKKNFKASDGSFSNGVIEFAGASINHFCLDQDPDKHRIAIHKKSEIIFYKYATSDGVLISDMKKEQESFYMAQPLKTLFFAGNYLCFNNSGVPKYFIYTTKGQRIETNSKKHGNMWDSVRTNTPQIIYLHKEKDKHVVLVKYDKRSDVVYVNTEKMLGDKIGIVSPYFSKDDNEKTAFLKYSDIIYSNDPGVNGVDHGGLAVSFPFVGALVKQSNGKVAVEVKNLFKERFPSKKVYVSRKDPDGSPYLSQSDSLLYLTGTKDRFYAASTNSIYVLVPPKFETMRTLLTKDTLTEHANILMEMSGKRDDIIGLKVATALGSLASCEFTTAFLNFISGRNEAKKRKDLPADVAASVDARPILAKFLKISVPQDDFSSYNYTFDKTKHVENMLVPLDLLKLPSPAKELPHEISVAIQKSYDQPFYDEENFKTKPGKGQTKYLPLLMYKAESALIPFLEKIRNPACPVEEIPEQRAIDFALLQLYLTRIHSDASVYEKVINLVKNQNNCDASRDSHFVSLLRQYDYKRFLALLYVSKGEKVDALKVLKDIKDKKEENDIIDEITEILSSEDNWQNIQKYARTVMDKNPAKAVAIFTKERENVVFRPKTILQYLEAHPFIQQQYLQFLIEVEENNQQEYHTQYALSLIKNLTTLMPSNHSLGNYVKVPAGKEPGLVGKFRSALIVHLEKCLYDKEVVRKSLQQTNLYLEQSILHRILQEYDEGIKVLLIKLKDKDLAEKFCDELNEKKKKKQKQQYLEDPTVSVAYNEYLLKFVKICFSQEASLEQKEWAIELLRYRARDIDPAAVLSLISEDTELSKIEHFLREAVLTTQDKYRKSKILMKVSESGNLDTHHRHALVTSQRKVEVNMKTMCMVCGQPIGDSVFAVFPDLSVIHYRCLNSKEEDKKSFRDKSTHPITGQDFQKYPVSIDYTKQLE